MSTGARGAENRSVVSTNSSTGSHKALQEEAMKDPVVSDIPAKPASACLTVVLLCLLVAFGGFVFGWDTGTISGFVNQTDFVRRFGQLNREGNYEMTSMRIGLIVSIFNIGCAIGGIILSKAGDSWGRRYGLMFVTLVYTVGIVIQVATVDKWYQYAIGRIISGLGVGGIAVLSPMLISETSPKHLRGVLVTCYQLMITAGIFVGYLANYATKQQYTDAKQWRIPLGLGFVWAFLMIAGMVMVPESPRYLAERGRPDDAKRSLARSNKVSMDDPSIQAEYDLIQAGVELEKMAGTASWGELFSVKTKVFQRLVMGIMVQSLQQLTGINYFFYYGTTIFKAVALEDSFQTSIILGVVNFVSTFAAVYIVGKFGRRKCLLWGAGGMAVCLLIFASIGVTKLYEHGDDNPSKSAGNVMIIFTCLYIFCFATTWAPLAFVIVSETFPIRIRSKGIALATAANWIWNFLIAFFTPSITSAIRFYYGYVFMGCLFAAYVYIFFFVPETKGLTLEEVEEMWQEGVLPWKSEAWVPSARRTADYDVDVTAKK